MLGFWTAALILVFNSLILQSYLLQTFCVSYSFCFISHTIFTFSVLLMLQKSTKLCKALFGEFSHIPSEKVGCHNVRMQKSADTLYWGTCAFIREKKALLSPKCSNVFHKRRDTIVPTAYSSTVPYLIYLLSEHSCELFRKKNKGLVI